MPGFVGTVYSDLYAVVNPTVFNVSTYVSDPTNALAGLNTAIAAVKANGGGTLVFTPSQTYTINSSWDLTDAADIVLDGNGATIKMANGVSASVSTVLWRRVRNFHWDELTIDANSAGRTPQITNSVMFFEANSTAIGGGRGSFANCSFINGLGDGLTFRGADASGLDPTKHSRNLLLYKCHVTAAGRNGLTINNAHNVQILGGSQTQQQGEAPASGNDVEPNQVPTSGPACSDILYRGVTCQANNGKGFHLSAGKGGANGLERVTIEGCHFLDGAPAPIATSQGSGVHVIGNGVLIQKNTFFGFTRTNQAGIIVVTAGNALASDDYLIFDNVFEDITTGDPCILITSQAQTGVVSENRGYDITGAIVTNNNGAQTTVSNNTSQAGAVTNPVVPATPWDVTFAGEGGGGGNLPAFVAALGQTLEANATAGSTTDVTLSGMSVQPGNAYVIFVGFRDTGSSGQVVSSVVLDPSGTPQAATFLGGSGQATNLRRIEAWILQSPDITKTTLRVTYNQAVNAAVVFVLQYKDVDSAVLFAATTGTAESGNGLLATIVGSSTRSNSKIVAGFLTLHDGPYTVVAPSTERADADSGASTTTDISVTVIDKDAEDIASHTLSTNTTTSGDYVTVGIELKSSVQTRIVTPAGFSVAFSRSNANVQITAPSTIVSIPFSFPIVTSLNSTDTLVVGTVDNTIVFNLGFDGIALSLGSVDAFATIVAPGGFAITFTLGDPTSIIGWLPDAPVEASWEEDTPL